MSRISNGFRTGVEKGFLVRSMYKAEFDFEILIVAFCGMVYDLR